MGAVALYLVLSDGPCSLGFYSALVQALEADNAQATAFKVVQLLCGSTALTTLQTATLKRHTCMMLVICDQDTPLPTHAHLAVAAHPLAHPHCSRFWTNGNCTATCARPMLLRAANSVSATRVTRSLLVRTACGTHSHTRTSSLIISLSLPPPPHHHTTTPPHHHTTTPPHHHTTTPPHHHTTTPPVVSSAFGPQFLALVWNSIKQVVMGKDVFSSNRVPQEIRASMPGTTCCVGCPSLSCSCCSIRRTAFTDTRTNTHTRTYTRIHAYMHTLLLQVC